jgi:hypothetical protein
MVRPSANWIAKRRNSSAIARLHEFHDVPENGQASACHE